MTDPSIPAETRIGHVHLKVGDLERAIGMFRNPVVDRLRVIHVDIAAVAKHQRPLEIRDANFLRPLQSRQLRSVIFTLSFQLLHFGATSAVKGLKPKLFRKSSKCAAKG